MTAWAIWIRAACLALLLLLELCQVGWCSCSGTWLSLSLQEPDAGRVPFYLLMLIGLATLISPSLTPNRPIWDFSTFDYISH